MPETIRTANETRSRPKRGGFYAALLAAGSAWSGLARADDASPLNMAGGLLGGLTHGEVATLTLTLGLLCFGVLATVVLVRTRAQAARDDAAARDEATALRAEVDAINALLLSEPQIIATWAAAGHEPTITGDTNLVAQGALPQRVLAFGTWLDARQAQQMDAAVDALRAEGRPFSMTLNTAADRPIEAEGRAIGGRAVLRLRDVSGIKRDYADLKMRYDNLFGTAEALRNLIDTLPTPIWTRDETGLLTFVNAAYVKAVEASDATDAVENGKEMFDRAARAELANARGSGKPFAGKLPAITAGARRIFDVVDTPSGYGSAGIAMDATEVENMRLAVRRMIEAHRRVLDQLSTGVAIFNADKKLTFYNAAYRSLWDLDAAFLDQMPADGEVLERLRAARKLPEEHNFREWKAALHDAYRSVEPKEVLWHLPDGRAVRLVVVPNPEGGVTYLFHDVSERLDMHRRYEALIKVQRETLDHLSEAVAVFASDGRVGLHNPAFARMWKLTPEALAARPHVGEVTAWAQALHDDNAIWRNLRDAVTGIENREPMRARIERRDGMMIDCATMPLPDGATLVTFQDVTDSVNVERALREKNEALETADEIKIDFVHHVSYELRSPLTNIIGFAHFLSDPSFGPLTAKQEEYLSYITVSTNSLLAIINNILDLATIDAGAMTLNVGRVDIRATMESAAEGIQDRLVKDNLTLDIRVAADAGSFEGDERRIRQVLFNLLSNAVGFSPPNETITLSATREPGAVVFSVSDHGPGIPPESKDRIFEWFETDPQGSDHRGPGLGLTLVRSFVELHGGRVVLDSTLGQGTTVTCIFPTDQAARDTHTPKQSAA
ncbi:MAG: PAS-domain containing protein [Pseudolabrys sp.]|nr:PAS-domain containing protein [Pseudolabrys sp.]